MSSSSSSSSSRRKFQVRQPVVVDIGCNCRKLKFITSLFSSSSPSKSKLKSDSTTNASSSIATATTNYTSSSWDLTTSFTSSTTSNYEEISTPSAPPPSQPKEQARRRRKKKPSAAAAGRVARESVAVVKETSEPYTEFKESMVQMIVEKEIYGWDDLNDLLHSFLSLNSPRHHHVIIRAFADLWSGVFSPPSPLAAPAEDYYSTVHNPAYYEY